MGSPLIPTVSYDVYETEDSVYGTTYEIFSGNAKVGSAIDWKGMLEFFRGRMRDGFREDIPVNLFLGGDHGGIANLTLETVSELK